MHFFGKHFTLSIKCDIIISTIFAFFATFFPFSVSNMMNAGKTSKFTASEVTTVDDTRIIELYFARDERAIEETKAKYGRLLYSIANRILDDAGESEECESDTYLSVWNSIPPTRPSYFSAYITRITRNFALNRLRDNRRKSPPEMNLILDEIAEIIPDGTGDITESIDLRDTLTDFVRSLDVIKRRIFIQRYFYTLSIKEIAIENGLPMGTVKSILSRARKMLYKHLTEREIKI